MSACNKKKLLIILTSILTVLIIVFSIPALLLNSNIKSHGFSKIVNTEHLDVSTLPELTSSNYNSSNQFKISTYKTLTILQDYFCWEDGVKTCNTNFSGKTLYLATNIDCNYNDFKTIGWTSVTGGFIGIGTTTWNYQFRGTFDGNGYKIYNIKNIVNYDQNQNILGFFGEIENAIIRNLWIDIGDMSNNTGIRVFGCLVGFSINSTISSCFVSGDRLTVKCSSSGLVAFSSNSKIENCGVRIDEINMLSYENDFSGLLTSDSGDTQLLNCSFVANISVKNYPRAVFGLVGAVYTGTYLDGCVSWIKNFEPGSSGLIMDNWSFHQIGDCWFQEKRTSTDSVSAGLDFPYTQKNCSSYYGADGRLTSWQSGKTSYYNNKVLDSWDCVKNNNEVHESSSTAKFKDKGQMYKYLKESYWYMPLTDEIYSGCPIPRVFVEWQEWTVKPGALGKINNSIDEFNFKVPYPKDTDGEYASIPKDGYKINNFPIDIIGISVDASPICDVCTEFSEWRVIETHNLTGSSITANWKTKDHEKFTLNFNNNNLCNVTSTSGSLSFIVEDSNKVSFRQVQKGNNYIYEYTITVGGFCTNKNCNRELTPAATYVVKYALLDDNPSSKYELDYKGADFKKGANESWEYILDIDFATIINGKTGITISPSFKLKTYDIEIS